MGLLELLGLVVVNDLRGVRSCGEAPVFVPVEGSSVTGDRGGKGSD